MDDEVLFFPDADALREWATADAEDYAWLGFERVRYGRPAPSLRVDAAAAVLAGIGWIPGERRAAGDDAYAVRFAPGTVKARKAPAWAEGPHPEPVFSAEHERRFREDGDAWAFFGAQPPRYRRAATWWVSSGKSEETRERRFDALVEACAAGERLPQLVRQL